MIASAASVVISIAALAVSITTFWLTHLRHGTILMSHPTIFFFGWDKTDIVVPKIMLRSALFSTSRRGIILENLYIILKHRSVSYVFSFWGYDDGKGMVRGSGMQISESGFVANHHFNPSGESPFKFTSGDYEINVKASIFGRSPDITLGVFHFSLSEELSEMLSSMDEGVLWDWLPEEKIFSPLRFKRKAGQEQIR